MRTGANRITPTQTATTATATRRQRRNGDNGKNLYNGLVAGGDDSSAAAELRFVYDDRHWRVRGLERNHSLERLKVNMKVTRDELFHVNLFDLYSASQRRGFIREAARKRSTSPKTSSSGTWATFSAGSRRGTKNWSEKRSSPR